MAGILTGFDPWASVGVTYVYDKQSYDRSFDVDTLGKVPFTINLQHHGIGIPLGLGIDYKVLPFLAIGPSFQYEIVAAVAGCMETEPHLSGTIGVSECSNSDSVTRVTAANTYGVWSVGLDIRLSI